METASIVVDLWRMRCSNCKVAIHDECATECPVCGAKFDSIVSNHVGLAHKLERAREAVGIRGCSARLRRTIPWGQLTKL